MSDNPFNAGRLSERFSNAIGNSSDQRVWDFHGTRFDAEDIEDIRANAELLAKAILDGTNDLVSDNSIARTQECFKALCSSPDDEAAEALRRNVCQLMDEQIGERVVKMQAAAENRLLRLTSVALEAKVDDKAMKYLRQVSQCYLFGLDEQCVIMCRAALEAAFLRAVPDALCKKHVGKLLHPWWTYSLDKRIEAFKAEYGKGLSIDLGGFANDIKEAANDIIHSDRRRMKPLTQERLDWILGRTALLVAVLSGPMV